MPTAEKAKTIEQARDWVDRSKGMVFTDYRGLKVKQLQALRAELAKKGGEIHVIKNTLLRLAVGGDITSKLPEDLHNGPTAVAFLFENETECTKALFDYAATNKAFSIKGAYVAGKTMDAKQTEAFSKLPPRDILLAQVIGAVAAPLTNLVTVIEALYADPIRVIGAVADKVAEGSPIPEPAKAEAPAEPPVAESTEGTEATEVKAEAEAPAEAQAETAAPEATEVPETTDQSEEKPDEKPEEA